MWVDDEFVDVAIRPQLMQPFDVQVTPPDSIEVLLTNEGDRPLMEAGERIPLLPDMGYNSMQLNVRYFVGAAGS